MVLLAVPLGLAGAGTINDNGVNVRSGPGTNYNILNTLTKGTMITILETRGDWQQIQYGSLQGWVKSAFISAGNPASSATCRLRVTGDLVNLRSGPDTASNKVGQVRKGDILSIIEVDGNWYHIKTPSGLDGYIRSDYVAKEVAPTPAAPVAPSSAPPAAVSDVKEKEADANIIEISENIAADAIKLSRIKDENGIKISMKSGAQLKGDIDSDDDKVTYEFPDHHIDGLFYFEEALGDGMVKVRGKSEDDKAVIEIEFPDSVAYTTASEDGGNTEVLNILNSIQKVEKREFGANGERLLITTATPFKYSHQQQGDSIIINLKNMEVGGADDKYEYDEGLIRLVEVTKCDEAEGGVNVTIKTGGLGKYTTGFSNDGTMLQIMAVGKNALKQRNDNLVVLDPGHGGKDTGARGAKINEKDVNRAVALQVGEILKLKGVQVEYTRQADEFIDLEPRADMANKLNAGLFVSIHSNANPDNSKQGTETYYYAPTDNPTLFIMQDERQALAKSIHQKLASSIQRPDRGVKSANFSVLRNTLMPSVLIEIAFISNPDEEALLANDGFRNQSAQAIAEGILKYIGK